MNQLIPVLLLVLLTPSTHSGSQQPEGSAVRLTVPKAPWTVVISGEAPVLRTQEIGSDGGRGYFMLTDEKTEMNASLFIEPADKCKSSRECRDMVWKAGNPSWGTPKNVKLSELGEISLLEFMVPEYQGQPVRQQNMYAEFVREGYWVDLHLSKVLYKDEDRLLFERIVKSVKFEPKQTELAGRNAQSVPDERIAKETMQLVAQASAAYLRQDYKKAIQLYTK